MAVTAGPADTRSVRRWRPGAESRAASNLIMAIIGVIFLLPLIWLILAAFNPRATASVAAPTFSLANFSSVLSAGAGGAIINSLYLAGVSTLIATVVSTLAGYVLSRHYLPMKGGALVVIIFLTGLPVTLLLIPTYQMFVTLGWLNSPFYTSLVLAATSVPFAIWLLKNFIDQVPREFEEAAAIDSRQRRLDNSAEPGGHPTRENDLGDFLSNESFDSHGVSFVVAVFRSVVEVGPQGNSVL